MADVKHYTVCETGFFYGKHYTEGDIIRMTEGQAKYEVLQGSLRESTPEEIQTSPVIHSLRLPHLKGPKTNGRTISA